MSDNVKNCIGVISKKQTPTKDSQYLKVYEMDDMINNITQKLTPKFNTNTEFLSIASTLFENEGLTGYHISNNQSKRVSYVNNYKKTLTFSDSVIKQKSYSVILHELAHSLCLFHGGYDYADDHGEIFVYFYFDMVKKYFNVTQIELEKLADKSNVSYFYDSVMLNKKIDEEEYKSILKNKEFLNEKYFFRKKNEKHFINHSGYDVNKKRFVCLFKNNNSFYLFERKMFKFEEVIHIDTFKNKTLKELSNIYIFSPTYNTDVSGYKIPSGRFHTYSVSNIETAKNNNVNSFKLENKSKILKSRNEKIKSIKERGFDVFVFSDYNQFLATCGYYSKAINNI